MLVSRDVRVTSTSKKPRGKSGWKLKSFRPKERSFVSMLSPTSRPMPRDNTSSAVWRDSWKVHTWEAVEGRIRDDKNPKAATGFHAKCLQR